MMVGKPGRADARTNGWMLRFDKYIFNSNMPIFYNHTLVVDEWQQWFHLHTMIKYRFSLYGISGNNFGKVWALTVLSTTALKISGLPHT